MTRAVLNGRAAGGMLAVVLMVGGCATERGEPARVTTRAVTSMQETRQELVWAGQQVDEMVSAMDRLAKTSDDLPQAYRAFVNEVSDAADQTQKARRRAQEMQSRWREYLLSWERESERIVSPELRAGAAQRREAVREHYNRLRDAAVAVDIAYQPFIRQLRDIQRALSLDLTPAGVEAAQPAFEVARKSAADLKEQLEAFVAELADVSAATPAA